MAFPCQIEQVILKTKIEFIWNLGENEIFTFLFHKKKMLTVNCNLSHKNLLNNKLKKKLNVFPLQIHSYIFYKHLIQIFHYCFE